MSEMMSVARRKGGPLPSVTATGATYLIVQTLYAGPV